MARMRKRNALRAMAMTVVLATGLAGCGGPGSITLDYPSQGLDLHLEGLETPRVYIESVDDLRTLEQQRGSGHFLDIHFPKQDDWAQDPTELYAEALARDLEQTQLVELTALRLQADYVISADLLSLGCRMKRSGSSFLVPALVGGSIGALLGDDAGSRARRAAALGAVGVMAIPMPSRAEAVAEVRLTLKDNTGNVLWRERCLGEVDEKVYLTATSRQDQDLLDRTLPKAIRKAHACLLGQLRQELIRLESE